MRIINNSRALGLLGIPNTYSTEQSEAEIFREIERLGAFLITITNTLKGKLITISDDVGELV